jgi:hypothetical protein
LLFVAAGVAVLSWGVVGLYVLVAGVSSLVPGCGVRGVGLLVEIHRR